MMKKETQMSVSITGFKIKKRVQNQENSWVMVRRARARPERLAGKEEKLQQYFSDSNPTS